MAAERLNVIKRDFLNSFKSHYRTYKVLPDEEKYVRDKRLLLFYAVECGLKYWIMKSRDLNDYKELCCYAQRAGVGDFGHNVKKMLQDRGMDRTYILKDMRTSEGQKVEPKDLNQFWRYGLQAEDPDVENRNVKVLDEIAVYLLKRL